ncbi:MAG TPA: hypothetical protein VGH19_22750 [Verrucomicrobiae bacterium]
MRPKIKPPTPTEFVAILFLFAGVAIVLGGAALWKASQLPPEKAELIAQLNHHGGWSLGFGVGAIVLFWLVRRFWPWN